MDIWFSGFGFVEVKGMAEIKIKYVKGTIIYVTESIIQGHSIKS